MTKNIYIFNKIQKVGKASCKLLSAFSFLLSAKHAFSFVLSALLISCTDAMWEEGHLDPSEDICFSVKMDDPGHATMTRSVGDTLLMDMDDWVDNVPLNMTRSTPLTTLTGSAAIFGYAYGSEGFSQSSRIITNAKYDFDGDNLIPEEPYAWTKIANDNKDATTAWFCSYAPYADVTGSGTYNNMKPTVYNSLPGVTYTVPAAPKDQTDFLYASTSKITIDGYDKSALPMTYKHALTAIQFRMGFACKPKSLTIEHIKNSGTFTFNSFSSGTDGWQTATLSGDATYTYTFSGTKQYAEQEMLVDGDTTLMVLPQTFGEASTYSDATMPRVKLVYDDNGTDKTISASLAGSSWLMGKKIVYTLNNTTVSTNYVYFDLAAGNIKLTATADTGYVYVAGVKTLVAGKHSTTNKYYIYQSTGETAGTYSGANTGYETEADMAYPEKCRVPSYPEITCNGESWGDYITNKSDVVTVLKAWNSNITATGRKANSTSLITVSGASTFDVTIDNLYTTKTNGQTGGPIDFRPSSKGTMNLKLKGDNRLNNIYYLSTSNGTGYLNITSSEGDGAKSGTITIGSFNLSSFSNTKVSSDCVALIGPHSGNAEYGLSFKGGTVFAGVVPQTNRVWKSRGSVTFPVGIGGGANAFGQINITGGRLTAVTNGTSTAIGGGGGYNNSNGSGNITITGGETYAYAFGVYSIDDTGADGGARKGMPRRGFVPTTAIGGPSTFSEDQTKLSTVTITGGYVYAESLGGTAIGGGSSRLGTGSPATISISGTANVVAKSISGTVCTSQTEGATPDYSVPASTAIGGGSSYADPTEDSRETAIGGSATINISGGKLTTGSLGGGNGVTNLGTAQITVSGGTTSGQFIMAAGASTPPTFTMTGGTILNSSTSDGVYKKVQANGGAVYMEAGTCNISGDAVIKGCSATNGGAVYMNGGTFNLTGGTITNNQASIDGGAVYVSGGDVKVTGGTISHNYTVNGNGGGVYLTGGNFDMPSGSTGSIIYNAANSTGGSTGNGGGIYVASTTSDVTASVISGIVTFNTADRNGGGMCVDMSGGSKSATITIGTANGAPENPMMKDNSAALSGGGLCVLGTSSNVTINSGTVKGNVSAYVKNEDIRNDGGTVTLNGTTDNFDVKYNTITFYSNNGENNTAIQRVVTNTNSKLIPPSTATGWTREFNTLTSWNTKKDGSGTTYDLNGGETMNISSDLNLYAVWTSTGAKKKK